MTISYKSKLDLVSFISNQKNWVNDFDINFFLDEKRKWKKVKHKDIFISCDENNRSFLVESNIGSASLHIKKLEDGFVFEDEKNNKFVVKNNDIDNGIFNSSSDEINYSEFSEIDGLPFLIKFNTNGDKSILSENGKCMNIKGHGNDAKLLRSGRFFHSLEFNSSSCDRFGIGYYDLLNSVKLLISKEIGVEPDIKSFNEIDPSRALQYMLDSNKYGLSYGMKSANEVIANKDNSDINSIQKPWNDVAEFKGTWVATPKEFFVRFNGDGFNVSTSLDHREWILSCGKLLEESRDGLRVVNGKDVPISLSQKLLNFLNEGFPVSDHRGREWACVIVDRAQSSKFVTDIRKIGRESFGLDGSSFATMNFTKTSCMIAMDSNVLGELTRAYNATITVMKAIASGSSDAVLLEDCLNEGADIKLVDPLAANKGNSFAEKMIEVGNDKLLNAYRSISDVHDIPMPQSEPETKPKSNVIYLNPAYTLN